MQEHPRMHVWCNQFAQAMHPPFICIIQSTTRMAATPKSVLYKTCETCADMPNHTTSNDVESTWEILASASPTIEHEIEEWHQQNSQLPLRPYLAYARDRMAWLHPQRRKVLLLSRLRSRMSLCKRTAVAAGVRARRMVTRTRPETWPLPNAGVHARVQRSIK